MERINEATITIYCYIFCMLVAVDLRNIFNLVQIFEN